MKNVRFALAGALVTTCAAFGEITIRSDYPGGNVKICGIDEANGVVRFAPDLRDTQGRWFHWDFTLRGAAGRKIYFLLPDDKWQYISSLGPAISKDGGRTWTWLRPDGTRHEPANAFDYTFGPDENETRFAVSIPYAQKDWDAFIAKWRGKGVVCGALQVAERHARHGASPHPLPQGREVALRVHGAPPCVRDERERADGGRGRGDPLGNAGGGMAAR